MHRTLDVSFKDTKRAVLSNAYYKYACGVVNEYVLSDSGLQLLARIDFAHRKLVYSSYRLRIILDELYRECVAIAVKSVRYMGKHGRIGVGYVVMSLRSIPAVKQTFDADVLEKIVYFVIYLIVMLCLWLFRAVMWRGIRFLLWPVLAPLGAFASWFRRRNHTSIEDDRKENSRKWGIEKQSPENET